MEKNERQSASWDLSNAFGNYASLVISQIATAGFSFASVTLCMRTLGAEGYGEIIAVVAAASLDDTSNSGASTQNASIRPTPGRMRSVVISDG